MQFKNDARNLYKLQICFANITLKNLQILHAIQFKNDARNIYCKFALQISITNINLLYKYYFTKFTNITCNLKIMPAMNNTYTLQIFFTNIALQNLQILHAIQF